MILRNKTNFLLRTIFSLGMIFPIYGLPVKEHLVQGDVLLLQENKHLSVIQSSKQAIIEWKEFNVGVQERIDFQCLQENGSVLNRVTGLCPSQIDGKIKSNENVFLINENGILIGPTATIDTKGFVGSTLNLKNEDFLEKRLIFQGNKNGQIQNKGLIKSKHQNIYLVSNRLENQGQIQVEEADAYFLSGSKILGRQGQIYIQSSLETDVMNQEGTIEAVQIKEKGGRLFLLGGKGTIHLSGSHVAKKQEEGGEITITSKKVNLYEGAILDCSGEKGGGNIFVGGGFQGKDPSITNAHSVWVSKQAKLRADAQRIGNGGQVIIWSDKQTLFGGEISARGGDEKGDGGFVEVSSPGVWTFQGIVDTKALNGNFGKLLLDPSDITIDNFGGSSTPTFPTTPPGTYNPTGATGSLDVSDIQSTLLLNNVTVLTSGGTGGSGTITINQGFSWSSATTFTAIADRNILIDGATLTSSGLGSFIAFDLQANQGTPIAGDFHGVEMKNTTINTAQGNINVSSRSGTSNRNSGIILKNTDIQSSALISSGTITLDGMVNSAAAGEGNQGLIIKRGSSISSNNGNINLTGLSNGSGIYNIGMNISDSRIESTGTGSGAATITLNGTGATGTNECRGIQIENSSTITSVDGNIDITAISSGTGNYNSGMELASESIISSTGLLVPAATITIHSTSGTGSTENHGMIMDTSTITSIDGNIQITPISRGTTDYNYGLYMKNSTISSTGALSNAANITVNATGGGGTQEVFGVRGDSSSIITTQAGIIIITGGSFFDPS